MTFDLNHDEKKHQTRAVFDAVFPAPVASEPPGPDTGAAEELLGHLTAPLGAAGEVLKAMAVAVLADGGSVTVIRQDTVAYSADEDEVERDPPVEHYRGEDDTDYGWTDEDVTGDDIDIDAEMQNLFGAKAVMDGIFGRHEVMPLVPLTPEVAAGLEAELLASLEGTGFPSRMEGISPDDPMYGLTQLVPEDAHGR